MIFFKESNDYVHRNRGWIMFYKKTHMCVYLLHIVKSEQWNDNENMGGEPGDRLWVT